MRRIWDLVVTLAFALLFALAIRVFAYEPFHIPSGSMIPTVLVGDYLFVSKYSYGWSRYSFPYGMPAFGGRFLASTPERGDVAVFKLPSDNRTDYIKRIVGLPGDRIAVTEGILHVNELPVARRPVLAPEGILSMGAAWAQASVYEESFVNGNRHYIVESQGDIGPMDETPVFTVPANHYFVMGDNRDNSVDSRARNGAGRQIVGFVPFENLVGRAEMIFFSERCGNHSGDQAWSLFRPWTWFTAVRWGRLFKRIR